MGHRRRLSGVVRLACAACLIGVGLAAPLPLRAANEADQLLEEWVVTGKAVPPGITLWHAGGPGLQAEVAGDPAVVHPGGTGAVVVRILKSPLARPTDIQLSVTAGRDLGKGGRYRVSFWARASRNASFQAGVISDEPPWKPLSADGSAEVMADVAWKECHLLFSPERDVSADEVIRVPYFGLGQVAAGTTLWFGRITLSEVEAPPPPVPLHASAELLANPGFEAGHQGWSPQAGKVALSGTSRTGGSACLVTGRTARWGTPAQDIRAALEANGKTFYQFAAWVRPVQGKGEALAVIHLRDAGGDRWYTTDTRRLTDTGYTRLSACRFITWNGRLEAADIGVQTTGSNTADILVDDFTLRAAKNLAQGRPCRSSGDADGFPSAQAFDGDLATGWRADPGRDPWIEVDLGEPVSFNACVLAEGETRTRSYELEAWEGGRWRTLFSGGEIFAPEDRIHFAPATGSKARLRITRADGSPDLREFALYAVDTRERTLRVPVPAVDPRQRGERTLVGAIRWDGWCGEGSPVGLGLERVMAPERYHFRLPFYARIQGPGKVEARCTSQETMDREIAFAREAGIDYWAFDWYPPGNGLATARTLYLASKQKGDLKWCAILGTGPFTDDHRKWLIEQFRTPDYQAVLGGRPLVYVFDASKRFASLVKSLRDDAAAAGLPTPFIVFMGWGAAIAEAASACGADGIGAYVNPMGNRSTFAQNRAHERSLWEAFRKTGRQMVATVTTGWDTRPFVECPVPWYRGARENNWVETATPDQVAAQLRDALGFVGANQGATLANTVLIYAWNENAEGGWIVPTLFELRDAGYPLRLDAVRGVLKPGIPRGTGWEKLVR